MTVHDVVPAADAGAGTRAPAAAGAPLVTIAIPTHHRPQWLPAAVASALAQSWAPLEVRVVDDGGHPATAAALAAFSDPRLHHDVTAPGRGIAANHRAALERARGEYVVFLSDDDALEPDFVARRMALFAGDPSLGVVFSGYTMADPELRPLRRMEPGIAAGAVLERWALLRAALRRDWSINGSLYRASVLRALWPPEQEVGNAFDTALHLRLTVLGGLRAAYGPWCDVVYRTHPGQESRGEATLRHFAEGERMYRHVLGLRLPAWARVLVRTDYANWQLVWGRTLHGLGARAEARTRLRRAAVTAPWVPGAWTQLVLAWLAPSRVSHP